MHWFDLQWTASCNDLSLAGEISDNHLHQALPLHLSIPNHKRLLPVPSLLQFQLLGGEGSRRRGAGLSPPGTEVKEPEAGLWWPHSGASPDLSLGEVQLKAVRLLM